MLLLGTRYINVSLYVPFNNHVWRIVSDVKVVSLPLYLMFNFWCYTGTSRQINILFVRYNQWPWNVNAKQSNPWCQSSELASVFGVTYFWSCVQADISLWILVADHGLWMQDNLECQGSQLASVFGVVHIFGHYIGTRQIKILSICMFQSCMDCEWIMVSDVKVVSMICIVV